jgi:hypothetical protein
VGSLDDGYEVSSSTACKFLELVSNYQQLLKDLNYGITCFLSEIYKFTLFHINIACYVMVLYRLQRMCCTVHDYVR